MTRRVVVTGQGCVSPLGNDIPSLWRALASGTCAIAPLAHPEAHFVKGVKTFAPIAPFDPEAHFAPRHLMQLDPVAQVAMLAARQAVAQAGLREAPVPAHRVGVIIGSSIGGKTTDDENARRFWFGVAGDRTVTTNPMGIPRVMASSATSHVGMDLGFTGPSFATSTACSTANHAIGLAYWLVRAGTMDAAVTGGADICNTLSVLKGWESLRVLSPDLCRPFCAERRGLVLGEGAGVVVIETLDGALARGATPLAEIRGFGMTADAGDITKPSVDGTSGAITAALQDGGLAADEIDYVNAHGTGTRANDETETAALRKALGAHAEKVSISSTKSMLGHALGAAGALELIATIGALREGLVPPTVNFGTPSPECDLDYTPNEARERPVAAALSNSFAFGGLNAVLALARFD